MPDDESTAQTGSTEQTTATESEPAARPRRRRATSAAQPASDGNPPAAPRRRRVTKAASTPAADAGTPPVDPGVPDGADLDEPAVRDLGHIEGQFSEPAAPAPRRRRGASRPTAAPAVQLSAPDLPVSTDVGTEPSASGGDADDGQPSAAGRRRRRPPVVTFQPPELPAGQPAAPATRRPPTALALTEPAFPEPAPGSAASDPAAADDEADGTGADDAQSGTDGESRTGRRRRGRRGRGRGRAESEGDDAGAGGPDGSPALAGSATADPVAGSDEAAEAGTDSESGEGEPGEGETGTRRRRRRRRRGTGGGDDAEPGTEDAPEPVAKVREPRKRAPRGATVEDEDGVRGITGSTRMAAKRARRQDGRDQGRRRPPIVTEAEFLARREAVERAMVVRQHGERTQIAVLEDGVLVEHYVTKASAASYAGNIYLGKVQNVLPSMEAAFVDIGKGRNAVLYAGEVNYDASALEGRAHRIEQALKSGQNVLVQVTKDPIGHKGARLTSQISLPGRYLVYVPEGSMTGISRKLPDTERSRLKAILKKVVPENAGVIIRTAAEGASEEELSRDVARLEAQWQDIQKKAAKAGSTAPTLVYAEPDLVVRVVRDVFNEDFASLVVQGDSEWDTIGSYVDQVAPDLAPRVSRFTAEGDVFSAHRVDEQLLKALDRKVYLPSGGSLVIDRTEAMVVIDVNTGKFVGKGGNLEETVTKNNLEAAEEIVRQLRLRDIGGIIVIDFIDMVLESNRDLVLRRLTECLGRDRTKHQVAEVTSLGLVQMTRKRVGQGLLESFSEVCPECSGRGVLVHLDGVPAPRTRTVTPADVARVTRRPAAEAELPEPALDVPEPALDVPEPSMDVPEPGMDVPEPAMDGDEPAMEVSQPATEVPEPSSEVPEPVGQASADPAENGAQPRRRRGGRGRAGRPAGPPVGAAAPGDAAS